MLKLLVLYSQDVEKNRGFYEALGFAFQKEQHGNGPLHYSCPVGDVIFEIYPGKDASKLRLGFKLEKLEEVLFLLEKNGFAVKKRGNGTTFVHDPEGRVVELYS